MMQPINWTRRDLQTKNGLPWKTYEVYPENIMGVYRVHGAIRMPNGEWQVASRTIDGRVDIRFLDGDKYDILEPDYQTITIYVHTYTHGDTKGTTKVCSEEEHKNYSYCSWGGVECRKYSFDLKDGKAIK